MKQNRATLFGLPNSSEGYELRDFLKRSGFPFEWIDLKTDDDARRLAGVNGLNDPRLPVCIMEKGSVLFRPSIRDLAAALDWFRGPKHERYDLAIYGAGPAGLSAAVYGASEGLRTIVLERSAVGGQAASTSRIDNYLGFPDGISGWELATRARQQAQRLGAEIIVTAEESAARREMVGRSVGFREDKRLLRARQSAPPVSNIFGSALLTRSTIWGVGCFTELVQVKLAAVQVGSSLLAAEIRRDKPP